MEDVGSVKCGRGLRQENLEWQVVFGLISVGNSEKS